MQKMEGSRLLDMRTVVDPLQASSTILEETVRRYGLCTRKHPLTNGALVDTVLVHGLNGHPYSSWTSERRVPRRTRKSRSIIFTPRQNIQVPVASEVAWAQHLINGYKPYTAESKTCLSLHCAFPIHPIALEVDQSGTPRQEKFNSNIALSISRRSHALHTANLSTTRVWNCSKWACSCLC